MPLFELFRLANRKLGPTQEKPTTCSTDPPFITENGFPELARGNGQLLMQGFSPNTNTLTLHGSRPSGEDNAGAGKYRNLDCGLSGFPASIPSGEVSKVQEDDLVPWLNYPVPGSLSNDYSSDFWPGLLGGTVNETSVWNETSGMQVFSSSLPLQPQISFDSTWESLREECEPSNSTSGVMNFSDFARPGAVLRSNIESINKMAAVLSDMDASVDITNSGNSNPVPCLQTSVQRQRVGSNSAEGKSFMELAPAREHEDVVLEDASKDSKQSQGLSRTQEGLAYSRNPVMKRASDDKKNGPKRKSHEMEESEGHSEDAEEKLDSAKKKNTSGHPPFRRGRAAEVHNLSERRRRDRINGKMRALQELIPNNNKADKASVLDKAIEYVKTLKLQLQMMTTGSGLYMAPMMLPAGMQHRGLDFMTGMPHINIQWGHFPGSVVPGIAPMASPVLSLHSQGLPLSLLPNNARGVPKPAQNQDQAMVLSGKESAQGIDKQFEQDTSSTCLAKRRSRSQASDRKKGRGVADSAMPE